MTSKVKAFLAEITDPEFLQKAKSFTDYPQSAINNAKKVLKWKEEHGDEVKAIKNVPKQQQK